MKNHLTRRRFIATAGAAASVTILGPSLLNFGTALAAASYVRRDVGGMDASDPILVSYRTAITAMQNLPATNPLSWVYQAAIHGTTLQGAVTAWNTCEHGTYFFWSWHRMYLYWFERIIRKMADDICWTLPYWNYTSPSERELPAPFRDPTSALYTANRGFGWNNGTASFPPGDVQYSAALAFANFTSGSTSIEQTPHNVVHGDIGGWMGSIDTAAQDPIFFLHHSNIDRLWDIWLAQSPGAADPVNDATWTNRKFTFFDENGAQVQMTGCDILRAQQQLGYTYEGEPPQVNDYCPKIIKLPPFYFQLEVLVRLPIPPLVLSAEPVSFPIDVKELRQRLVSVAENKSQKLFLELDQVEAERPPGVVWEVYVGLPANTRPSTESPFFVGNLALFGPGIRSHAHREFKTAHFAFAINRAILAALKRNEEGLEVTFVPHGVLINGKPSRPEVKSPVRIGQASLTVETEKRR